MKKQDLKSLYWLRKEIQREKRILAEGQRMNELQSKYDAICGEIYAIQDTQVRLILIYRYIDGMSWQKVANKMNIPDESKPRKIHNRFFEKLSENSEFHSVL